MRPAAWENTHRAALDSAFPPDLTSFRETHCQEVSGSVETMIPLESTPLEMSSPVTEMSGTGDLELSATALDFGNMYYAEGVASDSLSLLVTNHSAEVSFGLPCSQLSVLMPSPLVGEAPIGDFPVRVELSLTDWSTEKLSSQSDRMKKDGSSDDEFVVLSPKQQIVIYCRLIPHEKPQLHSRTSFYKVGSRFSLRFVTFLLNPTHSSVSRGSCGEVSLDVFFSATLCTSLMYVESPQLQFHDCVLGESYQQEIMVWNRSETELQFHILPIDHTDGIVQPGTRKKSHTELPSSAQDAVGVIIYDDRGQPIFASDTSLIDITSGTSILPIFPPPQHLSSTDGIIHVPSFAPKMLSVRLFGHRSSKFLRRFRLQNIHNLENSVIIEVKGRFVMPEHLSSRRIVIEELHGTRKWKTDSSVNGGTSSGLIQLGEWFCGKSVCRELVMRNESTQKISVGLATETDVIQEVRVSWREDTSENQQKLEDKVLRTSGDYLHPSVPPSTSMIDKVPCDLEEKNILESSGFREQQQESFTSTFGDFPLENSKWIPSEDPRQSPATLDVVEGAVKRESNIIVPSSPITPAIIMDVDIDHLHNPSLSSSTSLYKRADIVLHNTQVMSAPSSSGVSNSTMTTSLSRKSHHPPLPTSITDSLRKLTLPYLYSTYENEAYTSWGRDEVAFTSERSGKFSVSRFCSELYGAEQVMAEASCERFYDSWGDLVIDGSEPVISYRPFLSGENVSLVGSPKGLASASNTTNLNSGDVEKSIGSSQYVSTEEFPTAVVGGTPFTAIDKSLPAADNVTLLSSRPNILGSVNHEDLSQRSDRRSRTPSGIEGNSGVSCGGLSDGDDDREPEYSFVELQPGESRAFVVEIRPSVDYQRKMGENPGKLQQRIVDLLIVSREEIIPPPPTVTNNMSSPLRSAPLSLPTTQIPCLTPYDPTGNVQPMYQIALLQRLSFQYSACEAILDFHPSFYDFGTCSVGEVYTCILSVQNRSDLPVTLRQEVSPNGDTLELDAPALLSLESHEQYEVVLQYIPSVVSEELFERTCQFYAIETSQGSPVHKLSLSARTQDSLSTQLHDQFYKLYESSAVASGRARQPHNLWFGKCMVGQPNLALFRMKNLNAVCELNVQFGVPRGAEVAIYGVEKDLSSLKTLWSSRKTAEEMMTDLTPIRQMNSQDTSSGSYMAHLLGSKSGLHWQSDPTPSSREPHDHSVSFVNSVISNTAGEDNLDSSTHGDLTLRYPTPELTATAQSSPTQSINKTFMSDSIKRSSSTNPREGDSERAVAFETLKWGRLLNSTPRQSMDDNLGLRRSRPPHHAFLREVSTNLHALDVLPSQPDHLLWTSLTRFRENDTSSDGSSLSSVNTLLIGGDEKKVARTSSLVGSLRENHPVEAADRLHSNVGGDSISTDTRGSGSGLNAFTLGERIACMEALQHVVLPFLYGEVPRLDLRPLKRWLIGSGHGDRAGTVGSSVGNTAKNDSDVAVVHSGERNDRIGSSERVENSIRGVNEVIDWDVSIRLEDMSPSQITAMVRFVQDSLRFCDSLLSPRWASSTVGLKTINTNSSMIPPSIESNPPLAVDGNGNIASTFISLGSGNVDNELTSGNVFEATIPPESSEHFLLIWKSAPPSNSDVCVGNQLISEQLSVKLPRLTRGEIEEAVESVLVDELPVLSSKDSLRQSIVSSLPPPFPLALPTRPLQLRGISTPIELSLLQRNIHFGRVTVGDSSTRVITLVNESPVVALYSLSKSGSIHSGYIHFPAGKKGAIPAFSSRDIEIVFRPTMSCVMEEVITVGNVLHPAESPSIVVKAKVSRAEFFALQVLERKKDTRVRAAEAAVIAAGGVTVGSGMSNLESVETIPYDESAGTNEEIENNFQQLLLRLGSFAVPESSSVINSAPNTVPPSTSAPASSGTSTSASGTTGTSSSIKHSAAAFLGSGPLGQILSCTFKLKNLSQKRRQFVICGSSDVQFLRDAHQRFRTTTQRTGNISGSSVSGSSITSGGKLLKRDTEDVFSANSALMRMTRTNLHATATTLMESDSSLDPNVTFSSVNLPQLSARFQFRSQIVKAVAISADAVRDHEKRLDELETLQQKLKIALRKSKADKLVKYQRRISDIIAAEKAFHEQFEANFNVPPPLDSTANMMSTDGGRGQGSFTVSGTAGDSGVITNAGVSSTGRESRPEYYVELNAGEEAMVHVAVTFFVASNVAWNRNWKGLLPFLTQIRAYDSRDEDNVRRVELGALLSSSIIVDHKSSTGIRLASTAVSESNENDVMNKAFDTATRFVQNNSNTKRIGELNIAYDTPIFNVQPEAWCALPVEEAIVLWDSTKPQWKQSVTNPLLKLIRVSKEGRLFTGSLSLSLSSSVIDLISTDNTSVSDATLLVDVSLVNVRLISRGEILGYDMTSVGPLTITASSSATGAMASAPGNGEAQSLTVGGHTSLPLVLSPHMIANNTDSIVSTLSLVWQPPSTLSVDQEFRLEGELSFALPSHIVSNNSTTLIGSSDTGSVRGMRGVSLPFLCVYQHASRIRISDSHTFEKVSVGIYTSFTLKIENTDSESPLHYMILLESPTEPARSRGRVDILSGRTGTIPPCGTAKVVLMFFGTSLGRFEQCLWVIDQHDHFDQRRFSVHASVELSKKRLVSFPGLKLSPAGNSLYEPIYFGKVQIRVPLTPYWQKVLSRRQESLPLNSKQRYALEIVNEWKGSLFVSAMPNLKTQCVVYGDKECQVMAQNVRLGVSERIELSVVLRPTDVGKNKVVHSWGSEQGGANVGSNISSSSGGVNAGGSSTLGPSVSNVSSTSGNVTSSILPSATSSNLVCDDDEVVSQSDNRRQTRELNGGIRLIFSEADDMSTSPIDISSPLSTTASVPSVPRKLYETAVSFRATVGKSVLVAEFLSDTADILAVNMPMLKTVLVNKSDSITTDDEFIPPPPPFPPSDISSDSDVENSEMLPTGIMPKSVTFSQSLSVDFGSDCSLSGCRFGLGELRLRNDSDVFALTALIHDSTGSTIFLSDHSPSTNEEAADAIHRYLLSSMSTSIDSFMLNSSSVHDGVRFVVFGPDTTRLGPKESRILLVAVIAGPAYSGLVRKTLLLLNADTNETVEACLLAFVDRGSLVALPSDAPISRATNVTNLTAGTSSRETSISMMVSTNSPELLKCVTEPLLLREAGYLDSLVVSGNVAGISGGGAGIGKRTSHKLVTDKERPSEPAISCSVSTRTEGSISEMTSLFCNISTVNSNGEMVRRPLATWFLRNVTGQSLTVAPVSSFPLQLVIDEMSVSDAATACPSSLKPILLKRSSTADHISNTSSPPLNVIQSAPASNSTTASLPLSTSSSSAASALTSLLRMFPSLQRCGETVTLPPEALLRVSIYAKSPEIDQYGLDDRSIKALRRGGSIRRNGLVLLVETLNSLQSVFSSPTTHELKSLLPSQSGTIETGSTILTSTSVHGVVGGNTTIESNIASENETGEQSSGSGIPKETSMVQPVVTLPVLSAVRLSCDLLLPTLRVSPTNIDLGRLRRQASMQFICDVTNTARVDLLCRIGSFPTWLTLVSAVWKSNTISQAKNVETSANEVTGQLKIDDALLETTSVSNNPSTSVVTNSGSAVASWTSSATLSSSSEAGSETLFLPPHLPITTTTLPNDRQRQRWAQFIASSQTTYSLTFRVDTRSCPADGPACELLLSILHFAAPSSVISSPSSDNITSSASQIFDQQMIRLWTPPTIKGISSNTSVSSVVASSTSSTGKLLGSVGVNIKFHVDGRSVLAVTPLQDSTTRASSAPPLVSSAGGTISGNSSSIVAGATGTTIATSAGGTNISTIIGGSNNQLSSNNAMSQNGSLATANLVTGNGSEVNSCEMLGVAERSGITPFGFGSGMDGNETVSSTCTFADSFVLPPIFVSDLNSDTNNVNIPNITHLGSFSSNENMAQDGSHIDFSVLPPLSDNSALHISITPKIDSSQCKQSTRLTATNTFDSPLALQLSVEIAEEAQSLFDISCQFDHSKSAAAVTLLQHESALIKCRAVPKLSARLTKDLLNRIHCRYLTTRATPITPEDDNLVVPGSIPVIGTAPQTLLDQLLSLRLRFEEDDVLTSEERLRSLLKLRLGPFKIGQLRITPSSEAIPFTSSSSTTDNVSEKIGNNTSISSAISSSSTYGCISSADLVRVDLFATFRLGATSSIVHFMTDFTRLPIPRSVSVPTMASSSLIATDKSGSLTITVPSDIHAMMGDIDVTSLTIPQRSFVVHISNPSDEPLQFLVNTRSYRRPGLKLRFPYLHSPIDNSPCAVKDMYWSDTVTVFTEPSQGIIPPRSALPVLLSLQAGSPANAVVDKSFKLHSHDSQLSSRLLFCLPLEVWDLSHRLHPPSLAYVHLTCSLTDSSGVPVASGIEGIMQPILSQPISKINRDKLHLDLALTDLDIFNSTDNLQSNVSLPASTSLSYSKSFTNLAQLGSDKPSRTFRTYSVDNSCSTSTSLPNEGLNPYIIQDSYCPANSSDYISGISDANIGLKPRSDIRVRGVTPHSIINQLGYVDLGKQLQRKEAVEWLITLENRCSTREVCFSIDALSCPMDVEWLILGQSGGVILPNGSTSVMIYCQRHLPGDFISYLLIRETDPYISCVTNNDRPPEHVIQLTMSVLSEDHRRRTSSLDLLTSSELRVTSPQQLWCETYISYEVLNKDPFQSSSDEVESYLPCVLFKLSEDKVAKVWMRIQSHLPISVSLTLQPYADCGLSIIILSPKYSSQVESSVKQEENTTQITLLPGENYLLEVNANMEALRFLYMTSEDQHQPIAYVSSVIHFFDSISTTIPIFVQK